MQKKLEIESVALSEHLDKPQVEKAGKKGQSKAVKEAKVCAACLDKPI